MYFFVYLGTMCIFVFDYWHDFMEYKLYTLEQRMFIMSYNNFHYEMGIFLSMYAIASVFFILFVCPDVFIKKFYMKEKLIKKIKEGKKEFYLYGGK
jgi:hypothetical protein